MKQTHLFFPTPIVQDTIESDLEQYVMDLSRSDEGVKLSNKGGYQSKHFQKPENLAEVSGMKYFHPGSYKSSRIIKICQNVFYIFILKCTHLR